jgi:membrane associated rhomboid family serine protease
MVIVALVAWPAWRIWSGVPQTVAGVVGALAAWVGVILAAAVAGKVGGILVGRWRHKRLRHQLHQALAGTTGVN